MEAFSLLNYWKNSGGGLSSGHSFLPHSSDSSSRYSAEATTIVTSVSVTETEDEEAADEDDEGPFFDLKFSAPVEEEGEEYNHGGEEGDSDCTDGGCEFKFTLSSCSGEDDRVDPDLDFSPSGDVYFNGQILEEEEEEDVEPQPSSSSSAETEQTYPVKAPAAMLSASILKSATKLRVFMLGMKKSKLIEAKSEVNFGSEAFNKRNPLPPPPPSHSPDSTTTVSLKLEEAPIISLLARENSSRNSSSSSSASSSSTSSKKQNGTVSIVSEETRFVMMQKYLKKVKPLYIRVSRRYGEKLKHSGQLSFGSSSPSTKSPAEKTESPTMKSHKPGSINIPAGLKVVRRHLGKSRSSSSTTTQAVVVTTATESRRRDDSLLQQQDSIQSAILHCKRSFNSSRDEDSSVVPLPRSVSDPSSYGN